MALAKILKEMIDEKGVAYKEEIAEGLTEIWGQTYETCRLAHKLNDIEYDDSVSDEMKLRVWTALFYANLDATKLNIRYVTKMVEGKILTFNEATELVVDVMEDAYDATEKDYEKMKEK